MDHDLNAVRRERMLYRRDAKSSLLRSYVLNEAEYARLAIDGIDPETVAEEELFQRAIRTCEYDSRERPTREIERVVGTLVTITYGSDGSRTIEQESEC